jgi:hypothetical protein
MELDWWGSAKKKTAEGGQVWRSVARWLEAV